MLQQCSMFVHLCKGRNMNLPCIYRQSRRIGNTVYICSQFPNSRKNATKTKINTAFSPEITNNVQRSAQCSNRCSAFFRSKIKMKNRTRNIVIMRLIIRSEFVNRTLSFEQRQIEYVIGFIVSLRWVCVVVISESRGDMSEVKSYFEKKYDTQGSIIFAQKKAKRDVYCGFEWKR